MAETVAAAQDITCDQCREMLSEYVDGESPEGMRACIEKHLLTCTRCTTESTRMKGLKNIVRHWDGVNGSGEFRKTVMQRMIRESQQIAPGQLNEAAATATASNKGFIVEEEEEPAAKSLPPIWVLAAALMLAAIVYVVILKVRGMPLW